MRLIESHQRTHEDLVLTAKLKFDSGIYVVSTFLGKVRSGSQAVKKDHFFDDESEARDFMQDFLEKEI